jgi:integrase
MSKVLPAYSHFKPRNIGYVFWRGKRYYLTGAPFGSEASLKLYHDFVRINCGGDREKSPVLVTKPLRDVTLAKLADMYLDHMSKPGRLDKGELDKHRRILEIAVERYGTLLASEFGPVYLADLRDYLATNEFVRRFRNRKGRITRTIRYRLTRTTINHQLGNLKRVFKWAVSRELISADRLTALATVGGLRYQKSEARDNAPRLPVDWSVVEKVLPHLTPVVADMVRFQWHTGCRPQNVCSIKPCEVDTTQEPWVWTPTHHKAKYRGHDLVIFLGPAAQAVLKPYLDRPSKQYCFSPKESVAQRYFTGKPRKNRKPKSDLKHIRDHYTTDTYHQAVTHGIAQQATPRIDQPYRVAKFRAAGLVYWTPHQLRHAKAQMIRDQFGLEAAQAVLGHSSLTATQIYAKKRLDLAKELASKCG